MHNSSLTDWLETRDDEDEEEEVTTHGDKSPDPGEEHYTDPLVGEGESAEENDIL